MADVINLRAARKRAKREEAQGRAEQNRATFGRSKVEKEIQQAHTDRMRRALDAHRIEREDGT